MKYFSFRLQPAYFFRRHKHVDEWCQGASFQLFTLLFSKIVGDDSDPSVTFQFPKQSNRTGNRPPRLPIDFHAPRCQFLRELNRDLFTAAREQ